MSLLKGIDSEVIYSSSKFDFLIDDNIQFEFPKSEDSVVYFDTAGRSVLPKTVYESGTLSLTQKLFPWVRFTDSNYNFIHLKIFQIILFALSMV